MVGRRDASHRLGQPLRLSSVSDKSTSWFHCGRCGSLFRSPVGDLEGRECSECGLDPSHGVKSTPAEPVATPQSVNRPEHRKQSERGSRKKRKRSYLTLKLITGCVILVLAIVAGANHFMKKPPVEKAVVAQEPANPGLSQEEAAFLNEVSPLANQGFGGFLSAGAPEQRNQFVLNPITTASRMARFYDLNPSENLAIETLTPTRSAVLNLPGGRAIETLWDTADGRQVDAVFVEQDHEWRLDWDHFVRFSTYPWALFLAGSGEEEGEFRLLARQRLAEQRKDADTLSIVLYAPRFGSTREAGFQSPEFLVKRDTRNGRLLDAAFKLETSGKRVYNLNLPSGDPEGLIRVRVKVRRIKDDAESRFELIDVIACHWYSNEDPGVEVPALEPAK